MKKRVIISPKADEDVDDQFAYLAQDSLDIGVRFLGATRRAFEQLSEMPGIGSPREFKNPRLSGVRVWPVPGFRKHLIFYQATDEGIRVLRVLHAARDIPGLLEEE